MKAKDFDKKFDDNKQDIIDNLDLSSAKRPNQKQKRINIDFPAWVVDSLAFFELNCFVFFHTHYCSPV